MCQVPTRSPTQSLTHALTRTHCLHPKTKTASLSVSSPPSGSVAAFVDWETLGGCEGCVNPSNPSSLSPVSCSLPLHCHLLGYILTCCGRIISQSDFPHPHPHLLPEPHPLCICLAQLGRGVMEISTPTLFASPCLEWEYTHARCSSHSEYIVCDTIEYHEASQEFK